MTATHRVYTDGYVVVPNSAINDNRLTFRARGLLAYMLGRPPGWRFSADRMSKVGPDGPYAIRMALQELRHAGYYRTTKVQVERGQFVTLTEVAASPDLMPGQAPTTAEPQYPNVGPPNLGAPNVGRPALYVTTDNQPRKSPDGSTEVDLPTEAAR